MYLKMKISALLFAVFVLLGGLLVHAAKVEVIQVPSAKMEKKIPATVILPGAYSERKSEKFPVLYLLHGAGGNHASWNQYTQCAQLADKYEFIILCPDGGSTSWYFDSPIDPGYQYETHVAEECVQYMDQNYRTKANRGSRAISGMSMGGHGAMYLAIRHPETFGTSVCLMGGVDIRPFPNNWEIKKRLGEIGTHRVNWEEHTVINQAKKLKDEEIKIVLDCGRGDFFLQVNRALHMQLLQDGISHIYEEHEGVHNWQFCKDAIERQFPYIATQFAKAK
jgi:S-formylglutathione hydrolase FrmB